MNKLLKLSSEPYLNALLLGTVVGGTALFVIFGGFFKVPNDVSNASFLYNFQSLIAGLLAFISAILLVCQNHKYTEQKAKAAKTMASLAISEMMGYARECYLFIENESTDADVPQLNFSNIEILSRMNEYDSDGVHVYLHDLISDIQVYNSNIGSYKEETEIRIIGAKERMIYDTIVLYDKLGKLLMYTRDGYSLSSMGNNLNDLMSAARNMSGAMYVRNMDGLMAKFEKIIKKNLSLRGGH